MSKNKFFIALIRWYQSLLSPDHAIHSHYRLHCRFVPTCSEYAVLAFKKYTWYIALVKSIWRIMRCLPGKKHTIDLP